MGEGEEKERVEKEVVVMEGMEEEEEEEGEIGEGGVRWGKFLPRMPVRVLLVEGDDSTRQIIAALLRKCSYRVAVAPDGIKAWEILNEKSYSIDLVLTEVELPLMSGFGLLTMIMDHEICKNIPVIMMSSDDSISMVFKCMLKGASDFLVKPIRKNELRNLWQHAWRKQISIGGSSGMHANQDENHAKSELKDQSTKRKASRENVACKAKSKEHSEQESDAQSSCTRSNMETESKHIQILKRDLPTTGQLPHASHTMSWNAEKLIKLDSLVAVHQPEHEASINEDFIPSGSSYHNNNILKKASKEVQDLIQAIDDQPKKMNAPGERDAVHSRSQENNVKCLSSPLVHLELSLRRFEYNNSSKQENDERNTLNHSSSSAFLMYNNRIALASSVANDAPGCSVSTPNAHLADTKTTSNGVLAQGGTAVRCTPIRVVPLPIPVRGMPFDRSVNGNDPLMQPLVCPGSAHFFWSNTQSMWQDVKMQRNSVDYSEADNVNSKQVEDRNDQGVSSPSIHLIEKQDVGLFSERGHASSVKGESGSSSLCDGTRNPIDVSSRGSICNGVRGHSNALNTPKFIPKDANSQSNSCEGPKQAELHCLSPREVALNKFRLKRKDRCFEKKVRYQRRKILAEQRPRVKGQFVRQEQLVSRGIESDCHRNDSVNG